MTSHTHLNLKKYSLRHYRLSVSNNLNVKNIEIHIPNNLISNLNVLNQH